MSINISLSKLLKTKRNYLKKKSQTKNYRNNHDEYWLNNFIIKSKIENYFLFLFLAAMVEIYYYFVIDQQVLTLFEFLEVRRLVINWI